MLKIWCSSKKETLTHTEEQKQNYREHINQWVEWRMKTQSPREIARNRLFLKNWIEEVATYVSDCDCRYQYSVWWVEKEQLFIQAMQRHSEQQ